MVNITGELIHRPEFEEVRQLKKKLRDISHEPGSVAIDNSRPQTYRLAKKLSTNSHLKQAFEIEQHKQEMASLQKRIAHAGDVSFPISLIYLLLYLADWTSEERVWPRLAPFFVFQTRGSKLQKHLYCKIPKESP